MATFGKESLVVAAVVRRNLVHHHLVEPATALADGGARAQYAALTGVYDTILVQLRVYRAPTLAS